MKAQGIIAEVFLTAFKAMPKKEQNIFLSKIIKDARLSEDLIDITIAESRSKDEARPFMVRSEADVSNKKGRPNKEVMLYGKPNCLTR
jgi:hypothetical protein